MNESSANWSRCELPGTPDWADQESSMIISRSAQTSSRYASALTGSAESSVLPKPMVMRGREYVCMAVVTDRGIWHRSCVTPAADPEDIGAARSPSLYFSHTVPKRGSPACISARSVLSPTLFGRHTCRHLRWVGRHLPPVDQDHQGSGCGVLRSACEGQQLEPVRTIARLCERQSRMITTGPTAVGHPAYVRYAE